MTRWCHISVMLRLLVERLHVDIRNRVKYTNGSRPSLGRFSRGFQRFVEKLSGQIKIALSKSVLPPC